MAVVSIVFLGLSSRAAAQTLACFGDSITAESDDNASFCLRTSVPEGWTIDIFGIRFAPCRSVNEGVNDRSFKDRIGDYGPGDVVVIECRNLDPPETESYQADLEAVLQMNEMCHQVGATCVFFEQPAYLYGNDLKPWTTGFYAEVEPLLDPRTTIVPNDSIWRQNEWWIDPANYQLDRTHMTVVGARRLAGTLEDAAFPVPEVSTWRGGLAALLVIVGLRRRL